MMGLMADPGVAATSALHGVRQGVSADLSATDFGIWMASEQRRVYSICLRLLQDADEANSATQDVFFKAHQALRKADARDVEDPARWLTRIAVNTCLDRLRSRKWQFWRKRPSPSDEGSILRRAASSRPEAEDRYFASQIRTRLDAAMERLSARQRAVFLLRHYEDLSLEEISRVLNLDVGTVKAHMFRAVSKLREELRDLYGGVR
jgi:RNA polymerase sigma-70 factor (ECF subfamily)